MTNRRYFVRFVIDRNQARRDLRRGYSFSGYVFCQSKGEAREFWQDFGVSDPELGRCKHGWGLRLAGLCGFGPFDSAEEAEAYALEHRGYNSVEWPMAAIYTGLSLGLADGGDGDMFRPHRLVKVIEI